MYFIVTNMFKRKLNQMILCINERDTENQIVSAEYKIALLHWQVRWVFRMCLCVHEEYK